MSIATLEQYTGAGMILSSPNQTLYSPDQLQTFLDAATAYLESQAEQALEEAEHTEVLTVGDLYCSRNAAGWLNIFPKHFPITEVASVSYRLMPSATFTEIDEDLWSLNSQGRVVVPYSVPIPRGVFAEVEIVYTAGFAADDMPKDLVEACILVTAHFASGGYAAVDSQGNGARPVVPNWAWGNGGRTKSIVDETIQHYGRQF